jgi:hypothetical protein
MLKRLFLFRHCEVPLSNVGIMCLNLSGNNFVNLYLNFFSNRNAKIITIRIM